MISEVIYINEFLGNQYISQKSIKEKYEQFQRTIVVQNLYSLNSNIN